MACVRPDISLTYVLIERSINKKNAVLPNRRHGPKGRFDVVLDLCPRALLFGRFLSIDAVAGMPGDGVRLQLAGPDHWVNFQRTEVN
ncbi:MAG: hypothetical protein MI794_15575 [Pseudomonadales bacterium]|nr:hypothetical protein [Pseudomonadales bacterium]